VGSAQSYKVDIRLIAATNRDLRAMVKAGQFRDDLYYRLTATTIVIPPLRERRDALDALAAHFIEHYNRLFGKQINAISRRALAALRAYEWPGNVREFAHAIQSAVMLTDNDRINLQSLPEHLVHGWHEGDEAAGLGAVEANSSIADEMDPRMPSPSVPAAEDDTRGPFLLDEVIKRTLVRSLEETDGNRRRAADLLGISRSTLYRMLSRYGLAEEGIRRRSSIPIASPGSRPSRP
jgi:transcriptional regulator with PAS, ATPase and Fis domain